MKKDLALFFRRHAPHSNYSCGCRPCPAVVPEFFGFMLIIFLAGCGSSPLPDPPTESASDAVAKLRTDESADNDPPEGTYVTGRLLVKFRPGVTEADRDRVLGHANGARIAGEIPQIGVKIIELPANASETAQARAFGAQAQVEFAELDGIAQPAQVTPNDPWYPNEWHLSKIGCPQAWVTTTGSSSITIAILDTGVDGTHPDLSAKLLPGWNFYDNNSDTSDITGHGTAVAGVAAADSNNGTGVASPAWGSRAMPLRVCNPTGCAAWSTIDTALTWAADHGARVANISYAYTFGSATSSAAQYFQSRGGVVVASAGNDGAFDTTADNPYVLTVSATDANDVVYSWSNTGNNIDLAEPGGGIMTTNKGGTYAGVSGTSASAPIVASAAALVISANPGLSPSQVQDTLKQSADDVGSPGWDSSYGWGRVNVGRAVAMAIAAGGAPPDTTAPTANFSAPSAGTTVSGTITVQVTASDNVGVASVALYVDGSLFATTTTAPYSFSWNTTGLANAAHTLEARAADAAGNTSIATTSVNVSNITDLQPPIVAITSPVNGSTVGTTVSVKISASDNVSVSRVELYVDGAIKVTSTTAPFSMSWNARKAARGAHTLQCRAYDASGNVGLSPLTTVYK